MASFVSLFLRAETARRFGLPLKEFFIWTDDWEYTRRISRRLPCYVCTESMVVHAMRHNTVVDIATDSEERLPRYRYAYRNDVYLYRREGVAGWLWLLAKDGYHTARLLLAGRPKRIAIIWKGFWEGVRFRVQAEAGEEVDEAGRQMDAAVPEPQLHVHGAGQARFQAEIQAQHIGHGLERALGQCEPFSVNSYQV